MTRPDLGSPAISKVAPVDAARAVATQVMAFGADPIMRWFYPEAEEYLRHFPRFVRAFGGRSFENGTCYATEGFGGVGMWLPIDVHVDGGGFEALLRETVRPAVHSEIFAILEKMDAYHIKEPHWYLAILGVEPSQQGRGIGSSLLRHTLDSVDEQKLPAYLESSNPANVPLYQRHGFEVLDEVQIGSAPRFFPMLRPAR